jgi:short-subunit dehydrogenase
MQVVANLVGNHHSAQICDCADLANLQAAYQTIMATVPRLDSVIFMAAAYQPMALANLDLIKTQQIVQTNLTAAFALLHTILPAMLAARHGQIVLCASVAGYCGLPKGQPYSATKAGLLNLAESLRAELVGTGVEARVICPGFVKTPMTAQNQFAMPMAITADEAASAIMQGLAGTEFEISFPWLFTRIMKLLRLLPYRCYFFLTGRMGL